MKKTKKNSLPLQLLKDFSLKRKFYERLTCVDLCCREDNMKFVTYSSSVSARKPKLHSAVASQAPHTSISEIM